MLLHISGNPTYREVPLNPSLVTSPILFMSVDAKLEQKVLRGTAAPR